MKAYQGPKKDVSKLHHDHSSHRGREDDEASARPPLEFKALASIEDPGPRQFVIERFLPKGYPLLFYGDGGTTKSLLVLSMLQAIACGARTWLGLRVGEPMACAYVDFELDEAEQRRRAFEIAAGDGLEAPPQNLHYLCATGHPTREVLAYVLRACEKHDIGVVAIDSVGLALEGDPGKSRDVIDFFKELDLFKVKGITLILVDHQAKLQGGESYQSKLQYGNAYKGNLSRSRVQVEPKKKGRGVRSLVLRQNKGNFSDLAEPFGVKVGFEAGKISIGREELGAEDLSEERVLNTSDRILLAVYDGPRYPEDFYSQSVWGVEMPTVKNNISKLRKDGLVRDTGNREGQSREIELTDAGRKYVQEYLKRARLKLHHDHEPLREGEGDEAWIKRKEEPPIEKGVDPPLTVGAVLAEFDLPRSGPAKALAHYQELPSDQRFEYLVKAVLVARGVKDTARWRKFAPIVEEAVNEQKCE